MKRHNMEIQEIEIEIGKNGEVRLRVRGVRGMKCIEITKELEDALGGNVLREITQEALDESDEVNGALDIKQ